MKPFKELYIEERYHVADRGKEQGQAPFEEERRLVHQEYHGKRQDWPQEELSKPRFKGVETGSMELFCAVDLIRNLSRYLVC